MSLQIDLWQLIGLLLAFFGFVGTASKLLMAQVEKRLIERFTTLDSTLSTLASRQESRDENHLRLERELLNLKADLPLHYVRREDYVRGQTIIEAKLDALSGKLENIVLRGNHDR